MVARRPKRPPSYVNPLTALGFIETLKAEGHKAMVHTAVASNLVQMVLKLCLQEGIDLICVIRSDEQAKILKDLGAKYVINSNDDDFKAQLVDAMAETEATLGFDAIRGRYGRHAIGLHGARAQPKCVGPQHLWL